MSENSSGLLSLSYYRRQDITFLEICTNILLIYAKEFSKYSAQLDQRQLTTVAVWQHSQKENTKRRESLSVKFNVTAFRANKFYMLFPILDFSGSEISRYGKFQIPFGKSGKTPNVLFKNYLKDWLSKLHDCIHFHRSSLIWLNKDSTLIWLLPQ